jgi:BASS family bile acid:Na+ symporter
MRNILKKEFLAVSTILFALAIGFFAEANYSLAGPVLTAAWLLLALTMLQSRRFKKFAYTIFIFAAVTVAMAFPDFFSRAGNLQLKTTISPLLQLITFGVGCTMGWRDLAGVAKMPKAVLIGVVCHYAIMPLVGFTIATAFAFPPEIAAGVVLVGCMPSGLASNVMAFIAKANLPLSVTITAVSTLLSPVMTPLLMKLLGGQFVPVDFGAMFLDIIELVIAPIFAGILFNYLFHKHVKRINVVMPKVSMVGITCIIIIITAAGRNNLLHVGIALVVADFIHMTTGVFLGYWLGRLFKLSENNSRTIAIEVGMQNSGLASGIAVKMGQIATIGLAPAVNGPIMNTTFSLIATWWGNRPPEDEVSCERLEVGGNKLG